jgi:uncharacterized protein
MRFAIDVAFVDRQGSILRIAAEVRPWRIALSLRAFAVVELPTGALAASETRVRDSLRVALS